MGLLAQPDHLAHLALLVRAGRAALLGRPDRLDLLELLASWAFRARVA